MRSDATQLRCRSALSKKSWCVIYAAVFATCNNSGRVYAGDCNPGFCTRDITCIVTCDCIKCSAGMYCPGDTAFCEDKEKPCAAGKFAPTGSAGCASCSGGQYSTSKASGCIGCSVGRYSHGTASRCVDCQMGQYSPRTATECKSCPTGKYNHQAKSVNCTDCPVGQYGDHVSASNCSECSAGQYNDHDGVSSCKRCPSGQFSHSNASDCFDCHCGDRAKTCNSTTGTCICEGEWSGTNCTHDPCVHNSNCGDHGRCVVSQDNLTHWCNCTNNYIGETCNLAPCVDAAHNDEDDIPVAQHRSGNCTSHLQSNQSCIPRCSGTHSVENGHYFWARGMPKLGGEGMAPVRQCNNGTLSPDAVCQLCTTSMCQNGGTCLGVKPKSKHDRDDYVCNCSKGFSGPRCELQDQCTISRPCQYSGTCCKTTTKSSYECHCQRGFRGPNCTEVVTVWDSPPQDLFWEIVAISIAVATGSLYWYVVTHVGNFDSMVGTNLCNHGWVMGVGLLTCVASGAALYWQCRSIDCLSTAVTHHETPQNTSTANSTRRSSSDGSDSKCGHRVDASPERHPLSDDPFDWQNLLLCAVLAFAFVMAIALLWRSLPNLAPCTDAAHDDQDDKPVLQENRNSSGLWMPSPRNTVGNRLQRGFLLPLLAIALVVIAAWTVLILQRKAERPNSVPIERVWSVLSFGVILTALPMGVAIRDTYAYAYEGTTESNLTFFQKYVLGWQPPPHEDLRLLKALKYHAFSWDKWHLFLEVQRAYARASGMMPICIWLPYMANEMQLFLHGITTKDGDIGVSQVKVSLEGIRALNVICVALNFTSICLAIYAIVNFPAPQVWSPFMYFGIVWCIIAVLTLLWVTLALVWALSESRGSAKARQSSAERQRQGKAQQKGKGKAKARQSSAEEEEDEDQTPGHIPVPRLRASCETEMKDICDDLANCRMVSAASRVGSSVLASLLGSWWTRTLLLTLSNLGSIAAFLYGICYHQAELTPRLRTCLWVGVALSAAGLLISGSSLLLRWFPKCKVLPTDDSFRVVSGIKIALVMTKSAIVFLLSIVDDKSNDLNVWESWILVLSIVSLVIMGLMTFSQEVWGMLNDRKKLTRIDISHPDLFAIQYGVSFLSAKLAALFFVVQGKLPEWCGCNAQTVTFYATQDEMDQLKEDEYTSGGGVDCNVIIPDSNSTASSNEELTFECHSSCAKIFYSGGGDAAGIELVTFVLLPLMWVPLCVYCNNEISKLLDGLYGDSEATARVSFGLSETAHGYNAIAPLMHAVVMACFLGFWLGMDGYSPQPPPGLSDEHVKTALVKAGQLVTNVIFALNSVIVFRVIIELGCSAVTKLFQKRTSTLNDGLRGREMWSSE